MKKTVLVLLVLIPILFVLVTIGLFSLLFPKIFWSGSFIVQGWACHYWAQTLDTAGLSDAAWAVQENAVSAYEKSNDHLPSVPVRELVIDELWALTNMHLRKQDLDAALKDSSRAERLEREELKHDGYDAEKFRKGLAACLINSGRIFAAKGRLAESEACYKESTELFKKLISQKKGSDETQELSRLAKQELDEVEKKIREAR